MVFLLNNPLCIGRSLIYLIGLYRLWNTVVSSFYARYTMETYGNDGYLTMGALMPMHYGLWSKDSYTNIHTITIQSWYKLCNNVVGVGVVEGVVTLIQ